MNRHQNYSGKPCRVCGITLNSQNSRSYGGFICIPCQRQQDVERFRAKRLKAKIELGKHCIDCDALLGPINETGRCGKCNTHVMAKMRRPGPRLSDRVDDGHPCPRCSIMTTRVLCRDCRDVCGDLGEIHLWVDEQVAS